MQAGSTLDEQRQLNYEIEGKFRGSRLRYGQVRSTEMILFADIELAIMIREMASKTFLCRDSSRAFYQSRFIPDYCNSEFGQAGESVRAARC